jgi:hypothetical protein
LTSTTNGENPAESFYDAAPLEPHLLYQGEILIDLPLILMPATSRWLLLRARSGAPLEEALNRGDNPRLAKVLDSNQTQLAWDGADGDYVMARLSKRPVLVLSQTCDVSTKDFIAVAPIHPVDSVTPERKEAAIQGGLFDVFYLPANAEPSLSESFADFSQLQAVHQSYIKRFSPTQHFRLTPAKTRLLQQRITRYFGRPNSFDAREDKVPADGTYQCIGCFYMGGVVSSCTLAEGGEFHLCEACGGFQWVKRQ